jgi:hypothetical protein
MGNDVGCVGLRCIRREYLPAPMFPEVVSREHVLDLGGFELDCMYIGNLRCSHPGS